MRLLSANAKLAPRTHIPGARGGVIADDVDRVCASLRTRRYTALPACTAQQPRKAAHPLAQRPHVRQVDVPAKHEVGTRARTALCSTF